MEERIGKYELRSEIGRGGFGRVYRAYDPTVDRFVALKVLAAGADADLLSRFRNEPVAAGKLRHKNIVIIHEYGEHKGTPYLVMEFLEGQDLQHAMSNGTPLTLLQRMGIMTQVAEGLHCAHQNGVIHRDVKPANIMLLRDGSVKIMDFGIARLLRGSSARLTQKGYLVGSVPYMSPEQLKDGDIDALCDIWAYGVIYYELLTKRAPFHAGDPASIMYKIIHEEPPPLRSLAPGCPEALERIVLRALSKHRDLRYQNFEDLLFDTEPILIELRQQEGQRLLAEAKVLFATHKREAALNLIREVLELDPGNREARQLREVIQQQLQRTAVRPRVESLVKNAEEKIAAREYKEALDLLESAQRLDRTDPEIPILIERVRVSTDQMERAAKLLQSAQENLERKNLTAAQRMASEALRTDPSNPSARMLLDQVQRGVAIREEEQRRDDLINKARSLLLIQAFDEAMAILRDLRSKHPADATIAELMTSAEREKAKQEERTRIATGLAEARNLLKGSRFAEAVAKLEALSLNQPAEREVTDLLAHARSELARVQKAEAIDKIARQAWNLARNSQFDESIAILEECLQKYPGESLLMRIIDTVLDSKAKHDRERAVIEVLQRCDNLRKQNKLAEALSALDIALRDWSDDQALIDLRLRILQEIEAKKTAAARRGFIDDAKTALASRSFHRAIQTCEQALIQFPADTEISGLLAAAEKGKREDDTARLISEQLATARQLEAGNDRRAALDLLERTSADYPDRKDLAQELSRLRAAVLEDERALAEREQRRAERNARAEEERRRTEEQARVEEERRRAEERARAEKARLKAEEQTRIEEERRRAEERARAERLARAEEERHKAEQRAREQRAREEEERRRAEEQARADRERAAKARTEPPPLPMPGPAPRPRPDKRRYAIYAACAAVALAAATGVLIWNRPNPTVLTYAPSALSFVYEAGAAGPQPQVIEVAGQPAGSAFVVRATQSWINTSAAGKIPQKLEVAIQPGRLEPGTYSGMVEIAAGQEPAQWKQVPVNLTIKAKEVVEAPTVTEPPAQTGGSVPAGSIQTGGVKPGTRPGQATSAGGGREGAGTQAAKVIPRTNPQSKSTQGAFPAQGSSNPPIPHAGGRPVETGSTPAGTQGGTGAPAVGSGSTTTTAVEQQVKLIPKAQWGGKQMGRITWTGQLAPNARIVLGPGGLTDGPGSARGDHLPGVVDIAVTEVTPSDLRVDATPTRIVIVNAGRSNVEFIQIRWRVK